MVGISKTEVGDSMDLHLGALGALGFCQPDGSFITTPDDLREVLVEMAGAGEAVVVDADVAVAALTTDGHVGQLYEVTGPRLLGWAQAVAEIARASGRPIRYVPVSLEDYAALLIENQVPADYVKMLTDVFAEVLDGRNAHLSDGVQRALGRGPRDFSDYVRDAAATGVWDG